jgi:hypothetical protein
MLLPMRSGLLIPAMLFAALAKAQALEVSDDLTITGYGDLRVVAPAQPQSWLDGGLGKFRYGGSDTKLRAAEAVLQADFTLADGLHAVTLLRAEPQTPGVVDALETYLRYTPAADGDISWSVKAGAFFPTISLENDDLGWASPYTLTPSAINSWIGDELRTIGSEATLRWKTDAGTLSLMGALTCCNDEAGIVMADRGWAMDDRPSGLFERVRLPTATMAIFHAPLYARTGLFDEIDGTPGWYAGATWQMPDIGKITVTRYDNEADPAAVTTRDTAWRTQFWNFGARTAIGSVTLIAQQMSGSTEIVSRGNPNLTKFESGFLLASTDVGDWRFSLREDLFQTRRAHAANNTWSEDGDAFTASASWSPRDWLRLTGEVIAMHTRRGEYLPAGLGPERNDTQTQVSSRFFF